MSSQPSPDHIMQVGLGFWASKTLLTAVELDLFTVLSEGAADIATLRDRLGLHERAAADFLDALVALGFLTRTEGQYANAPDVDTFLVAGKSTYVGGMLNMANNRLYKHWGNLADGLRLGLPQNETIDEGQEGLSEFEILYRTPQRLRAFLEAMTGISLGAAHAMAAKFPFGEYQSVIDIGCAQGGLPVTVARRHTHLQGGGFDLPPVRPIFEEYVENAGLTDRVGFHEGDFFGGDIPSADVLVMGHILHDWNLEQKRMLLDNAYKALPKGGALVVYEALIDDDRSQNAFGLLMSLNMLIETEGGFDYTGADCRGWLHDAGFRETRVEHLAGPDSMVVGIK